MCVVLGPVPEGISSRMSLISRRSLGECCAAFRSLQISSIPFVMMLLMLMASSCALCRLSRDVEGSEHFRERVGEPPHPCGACPWLRHVVFQVCLYVLV